MKFKKTGIIFIFIVFLGWVWPPGQAVRAQAGAGVEGGVFEDLAVQPDSRVEVPVEIRNVADLYAVDIEIQFDPSVVMIEDANPNVEGVQPGLGTFLDAGLTLYNEADNEEGVVRFVMTQVNPSEPKTGSGVVLVLYVRGVKAGQSDLKVTRLDLSTRGGEAIPAKSVSAQVLVSEGAVAKESTAIPVQDPTLMVQIPTAQPTKALPTPTPTIARTATLAMGTEEEGVGDSGYPQGTEFPEEAAYEVEEDQAIRSEGDAQEAQGFVLLHYWWLVLILVLAVVGLGIYLWLTRK